MAHQNPPGVSKHSASPESLLPAAVREREAARYIARSVAYLKKSRLVGAGPPFVRVRRSVTYRLSDLDRWLDQHVVRLDG